jgi:hypothetical protein
MRNSKWPVVQAYDSQKHPSTGDFGESIFNVSSKHSYFDHEDDFIKIHVSCPTENKDPFVLKNVYDYSQEFSEIVGFKNYKYLVFHISDNSELMNTGKDIDNIILGKVLFSEIIKSDMQPANFDMRKAQGMIIQVFNDKRADLSKWSPFDKAIIRPEESGGGVIVGRP